MLLEVSELISIRISHLWNIDSSLFGYKSDQLVTETCKFHFGNRKVWRTAINWHYFTNMKTKKSGVECRNILVPVGGTMATTVLERSTVFDARCRKKSINDYCCGLMNAIYCRVGCVEYLECTRSASGFLVAF